MCPPVLFLLLRFPGALPTGVESGSLSIDFIRKRWGQGLVSLFHYGCLGRACLWIRTIAYSLGWTYWSVQCVCAGGCGTRVRGKVCAVRFVWFSYQEDWELGQAIGCLMNKLRVLQLKLGFIDLVFTSQAECLHPWHATA